MQISSVSGYRYTEVSSRPLIRGFSHPDALKTSYLTKSEPSMSEEEYREAIVTQAKKDAAIGDTGVECPGFKALMDDFVSVVSPDRRGIIQNGIEEGQQQIIKSRTLLEILFGDGFRFEMTDSKVTYGEFHDSDGQLIAMYSENSGWLFPCTNQENSRMREFYSIYMDAWNAETQLLQGQAGAGRPVHPGGGLDVTI